MKNLILLVFMFTLSCNLNAFSETRYKKGKSLSCPGVGVGSKLMKTNYELNLREVGLSGISSTNLFEVDFNGSTAVYNYILKDQGGGVLFDNGSGHVLYIQTDFNLPITLNGQFLNLDCSGVISTDGTGKIVGSCTTYNQDLSLRTFILEMEAVS